MVSDISPPCLQPKLVVNQEVDQDLRILQVFLPPVRSSMIPLGPFPRNAARPRMLIG